MWKCSARRISFASITLTLFGSALSGMMFSGHLSVYERGLADRLNPDGGSEWQRLSIWTSDQAFPNVKLS